MTLLRSAACNFCRKSRFPLRRGLATASASARDDTVKVVEVGPRDGLQNEKKTISVATKIEFIEKLARTGLRTIEAGSFVSPKWVPQMADSNKILEHLLQQKPSSGVPISYAFLVPNTVGMVNAVSLLKQHEGAFTTQASPAPADDKATKPSMEMAVFAAATESFSQKNLNCDIKTSIERLKPVIQSSKLLGLRVRAYISVVLGCPFEGLDVSPSAVADLATDLLGAGVDEISLGDTTGTGTAPRTSNLLRCVASAGIRNEDVAMHFHDTYGQALVNTAVSLEHGIRTFDSSVGGLGGCPYSPGATGNLATENLVYFLETLGMRTGVDLDKVADVGAWITEKLGKANDSCVGKAVLGARAREAADAAKAG